jgi:hypothetical protein
MQYSGFYILLLTLAASVFSWPIDSMFARGDSCVQILWTPDSHNTDGAWFVSCGAACTDGDTVCLHSDFLPGITYRGIAYSYGGDDPYLIFRSRLAAGTLAGSHLCHYTSCGDPSDTVTGIDCSAFNCYMWNVPRQSTAALVTNSAYIPVAKQALQPGDMLVKPSSHSVMVIERDDSTHWIVQEATGTPINGCRERLIDLTAATWTSYQAIRNPALETSTLINPLLIPDRIAPEWVTMFRTGTINWRQLPAFSRIEFFDISGRLINRILPDSPIQTPRLNGIIACQVVFPDGSQVWGRFSPKLQ